MSSFRFKKQLTRGIIAHSVPLVNDIASQDGLVNDST